MSCVSQWWLRVKALRGILWGSAQMPNFGQVQQLEQVLIGGGNKSHRTPISTPRKQSTNPLNICVINGSNFRQKSTGSLCNTCGLWRAPRCKLHRRVFALLRPEKLQLEMAKGLQNLVFRLPGCRLILRDVGPATTQNLVVKFDGDICGGVVVENASDDFPQQKKLENLLPNFAGSSPPTSPKTSPTSLWKSLVLSDAMVHEIIT